jgi:putative lipoic acid-binding regulatory protein
LWLFFSAGSQNAILVVHTEELSHASSIGHFFSLSLSFCATGFEQMKAKTKQQYSIQTQTRFL